MRISIKPLSVNLAWQGRRYKTPVYLAYEKEFMLKLNSIKMPPSPLEIFIEYGFSNKASDIDNPTKLVLDIMQKKYGFNDADIYSLHLKKTIVKKGKEFIDIEINKFAG